MLVTLDRIFQFDLTNTEKVKEVLGLANISGMEIVIVHPTITIKFKLLIKSQIRKDEDIRNIFGCLNSKHFIQMEEEE